MSKLILFRYLLKSVRGSRRVLREKRIWLLKISVLCNRLPPRLISLSLGYLAGLESQRCCNCVDTQEELCTNTLLLSYSSSNLFINEEDVFHLPSWANDLSRQIVFFSRVEIHRGNCITNWLFCWNILSFDNPNS